MNLSEFIAARADEILRHALESLTARGLERYRRLGPEATTAKLRDLLGHVIEAARSRDLVPVLAYGERIARERYESGFEFAEVQSAINALEESLWHALLTSYPQAQLGEALGVVATVLGAAKDRLASTYISVATGTHTPSLDLQALFRGTQNTGGGASE